MLKVICLGMFGCVATATTVAEIRASGAVPVRRVDAPGAHQGSLATAITTAEIKAFGEQPVRRMTTRESEPHSDLRATATHSRAWPPRTAILLVGLMRGQASKGAPSNSTMFADWLKHFSNGIVIPNNADIFLHTESSIPDEVKTTFGPSLKDFRTSPIVVDGKRVCASADCQYWHLKEAWKLMENWERFFGQYQVVLKARTELSTVSPSVLNFAGWETPKRIHMLTDMMFWGRREDMAQVVDVFDAITDYFKNEHPDPFQRPICVKALLDSIKRYRRSSSNLQNKLSTLPYPDMGRKGAIENLQAALDAGMETVICDGTRCKARCGDSFSDSQCASWREVAFNGVIHSGAYTRGGFASEKDLLDWVISRGFTVCDLGASARTIYWKGTMQPRRDANDCELP